MEQVGLSINVLNHVSVMPPVRFDKEQGDEKDIL
jgi:hypothetical protein